MKFKRITVRYPMFNLFSKNSDLILSGIKFHLLGSKLEKNWILYFSAYQNVGDVVTVLKICFTKSG